MTEAAVAAKKPIPIVSFLRNPDTGPPHLAGCKCGACGQIFLGDERTVCSACSERGQMKPMTLSNQGELYVFSIIYRSFPGVDVPFISAVVDLEGGGTVKGNLINIQPDPAKIKMGMPVEVIYKVAPRKDRDGNEYLTYYFQPRS